MEGYMTVEEAIEQKMIFILDYHDWFLPYAKKVREVEASQYESRNINHLGIPPISSFGGLTRLRSHCCTKPYILAANRKLSEMHPIYRLLHPHFCSLAYGQYWRYDHQGLPVDLITRGMTVEGPSAPRGLRLSIKDYPYANDGLILWDAL
ncbi:hypothetical protein F3Y22_tig00007792pilonHSYRG00013 [Hibiscus syriacus]|uniref:Lipoxygenase domain-containing protein n=1 Tax=Hibiscus syriacus TaxID=106335 RepID=A0A6A3CEG3_HIBSY|nr:hypothetical protein F3Y22_tig00007792pilonHSYRG00013 [Hibiscus syriacus]